MKHEILKHGIVRAYNRGCRCDLCKKARAEYLKILPIKKHGIKYSYDRGCRCEICKNFMVKYRQEMFPRRKRKASAKHGTQYSYYKKGCRCNLCRKAVIDYRKNAPIYEHGKKWAYDKGCRCEACCAAKTAEWYKLNPDTNRQNKTNYAGQMRVCSDCKVEKSFAEFSKNIRHSGGISYICKKCARIRVRRSPVQRYRSYKENAEYRGIKFDLSMEQFMLFWDKPCYYCGDAIDGIGLDRKDSYGGYSVGNVVPCCATCNYAKSKKLSTDQFIAMCKKVAKRFRD